MSKENRITPRVELPNDSLDERIRHLRSRRLAVTRLIEALSLYLPFSELEPVVEVPRVQRRSRERSRLAPGKRTVGFSAARMQHLAAISLAEVMNGRCDA